MAGNKVEGIDVSVKGTEAKGAEIKGSVEGAIEDSEERVDEVDDSAEVPLNCGIEVSEFEAGVAF